jgi:hypothetical protein
MAKKRFYEGGTADQMAKASSKNFGEYMGGSWLTFAEGEMAGMPRGVKYVAVPTAEMGLNVAVPGNIVSINKQINEDHMVTRRVNTNPKKV